MVKKNTKKNKKDKSVAFSKIKKRDGRVVKFDAHKIAQAIQKAGEVTQEFKEKTAQRLALKVLSLARETITKKVPTVEEIQDIVEEVLLTSAYKKTAKAYIIYRDQHSKIREISEGKSVELVQDYLKNLDWQVNENSNMSYSLQGLNNYIAEEITKVYWLNEIYPKEIRDVVISGDFHIHDLGFLGSYCVGWDLEDLLLVGFKGIAGKIESKPAKHFRTALGQIVNFFYTTQGESAGAQAFSSFDTLLAPFVRYDDLSYEEVKQAMQEFIFNMNVPTRVGFQTPFTNITMDLNVPSTFKDKNVIVGGKPQKDKYGDFQKEMNLINQAFLEVMEHGDAQGRVFTFPIPTYNITKDFDWDNKGIEKLWEVSAKYGIPYFSNFVNSDMDPEDARSMCCRLRLDNRELRKRGGGLFGSNPLTGSIGVVTINMPRIGLEAKNQEEFYERLEKLMNLAKESLEIKRKTIEKFTEGGLYPYSRFYLRSIYKRFGQYWKNHFSTIGLLGMNEACVNLLGQDITTPEGNQFAQDVLTFMRNKMLEFQEETGNMYNLEATPAEGTSYRLALKDKNKYTNVNYANNERVRENNADPFYTNSSHLPVNFSNDVFKVLDLQDPLQTKYTGGTVLHLFTGEKINDPQIVKKLVQKICNTYKLPYFTITPTFSVCPDHGYIAGEHSVCPKCHQPADVYSRTVGYIRPVKYWNRGKKEEFVNRKLYNVDKAAEIHCT